MVFFSPFRIWRCNTSICEQFSRKSNSNRRSKRVGGSKMRPNCTFMFDSPLSNWREFNGVAFYGPLNTCRFGCKNIERESQVSSSRVQIQTINSLLFVSGVSSHTEAVTNSFHRRRSIAWHFKWEICLLHLSLLYLLLDHNFSLVLFFAINAAFFTHFFHKQKCQFHTEKWNQVFFPAYYRNYNGSLKFDRLIFIQKFEILCNLFLTRAHPMNMSQLCHFQWRIFFLLFYSFFTWNLVRGLS